MNTKSIHLPVSVTIREGKSYQRYIINPETPDETETTFVEILRSYPSKNIETSASPMSNLDD